MERLREIVNIFANCGWDLLTQPCKAWLEGKSNNCDLRDVILQADEECGSCGCEFDALYKEALELLK